MGWEGENGEGNKGQLCETKQAGDTSRRVGPGQHLQLARGGDVHSRLSRSSLCGSSCSCARAFTSAWSWSLVLSMLLLAEERGDSRCEDDPRRGFSAVTDRDRDRGGEWVW